MRMRNRVVCVTIVMSTPPKVYLFTPSEAHRGDAAFAWQPCCRILASERRPVALRPTLSKWFALFRSLQVQHDTMQPVSIIACNL